MVFVTTRECSVVLCLLVSVCLCVCPVSALTSCIKVIGQGHCHRNKQASLCVTFERQCYASSVSECDRLNQSSSVIFILIYFLVLVFQLFFRFSFVFSFHHFFVLVLVLVLPIIFSFSFVLVLQYFSF